MRMLHQRYVIEFGPGPLTLIEIEGLVVTASTLPNLPIHMCRLIKFS